MNEATIATEGEGTALAIAPAAPAAAHEPAAPRESAQVIRLADWKDAEKTGLVPHEPQETDFVVALASEEGGDDPAA